MPKISNGTDGAVWLKLSSSAHESVIEAYHGFDVPEAEWIDNNGTRS